MKYTISIIIPVYNVEPYIRQCLDSIVNQTYSDLEVIVIDDGSPDGSGAICDEYAERDHRVTVIHKQNGGVNSARNLGIQRATGDWIAFVDSDDWCDLDYYERFIKEIGDTCPDIFQSTGFILNYPSNNSRVEYNYKHPYLANDRTSIKNLMMDITRIGLPWDKLYRRNFLVENNLLFDVSCKSLDDHLFNFIAFDHACVVAGSPFVGYHYRQVAMSITKGLNPKKDKQNYETITKLYNYIKQQNLPKEIEVAAQTDAILGIITSLNCYYFHTGNKKPYREVANELKEMKKWEYYHDAIWSKNNHFLTLKQCILKYALRLPWILPIKVLHMLKQKIKQ